MTDLILTMVTQYVTPYFKFNESFHQRLESIQYNAAIAIIGAIRGTSSEKLYPEALSKIQKMT